MFLALIGQDYASGGVLAVGQPVLQRSGQLHQSQWRRPPDREVIPLPNRSSISLLVCTDHRVGPLSLPTWPTPPDFGKIIVK